MSNNAEFSITIRPAIPADLTDKCFEILLLGRMLELTRTSDGYIATPGSGFHDDIDLTGLQRSIYGYDSPLANALRDVIVKPPLSDKKVTRDDVARAMNMPRFDVEHVLQEICRLHEERIPHFELTWSHAADMYGRGATGAQFITPDGIATSDPLTWLQHQKNAYDHDTFQSGIEWEQAGHDRWEIELPIRDWRQAAFRLEPETLVVTATGKRFELSMDRPDDGQSEHLGSYPTLRRAMLMGGQVAYEAENNSDRAILESMGLSDGEWEITEVGRGVLSARSMIDPDLVIAWDTYKSMHFTLISGTVEIAATEYPMQLLPHLDQGPAPHP